MQVYMYLFQLLKQQVDCAIDYVNNEIIIDIFFILMSLAKSQRVFICFEKRL